MSTYASSYTRAVRYSADADHAAFRAAIAAAPGDLTPRMVYADYLDEMDPANTEPGTSAILRHHRGSLKLVDNEDGRTRANFVKHLHIGTNNRKPIYVRVEYKDGNLSLTGTHGRSGGQIQMGFAHRNPAHDDSRYADRLIKPHQIKFAAGWNSRKWLDLLDVWKRWHLNDMKAGSPSQEEHLAQNPVHVVYPQSHYEQATRMLTEAGLNPDPVTGYRYGHGWNKQDVPAAVLEFLAKLPETDRPAARR